MNIDDLTDKFRPWFVQHQRLTWVPIVEDADDVLIQSKFSGVPVLPDGVWPVCNSCHLPMQMFLQLELSRLPDAAADFGTGMLQFFFCVSESDSPCYIDCYGNPFAGCQVVRIVDPSNLAPGLKQLAIIDDSRASRIVGWTQSVDYPSPAEREELGLVYADEALKWPAAGIEEAVSIEDYFEWTEAHTCRSSKLGGWPAWVQNVEYANCPICNKRMDVMVFQFASNDNFPFTLGDGGVGQIIQCPQHKDSLAFVWASG